MVINSDYFITDQLTIFNICYENNDYKTLSILINISKACMFIAEILSPVIFKINAIEF